MVEIYYLLFIILGIFVGWLLAIYRISKNPNIIKLNDDEVVCKKPPQDTVLVAVTTDVARRLIYSNEKKYDENEMRNLRRNT